MAITIGTSTMTVDSGAVMGAPVGSTPLFFCRAWINFSSGSNAIAGSGNISSVTNVGTGEDTVSFTTAMSDNNYIGVTGGGIDGTTTTSSNARQGPATSNHSSGACRISLGFDNGAFTDWNHVTVAFFR